MSEEVSVHCVNAVVYKSPHVPERQWDAVGESQWAEMHLFKDESEDTASFRLVAWIPATTEVVLNSNVVSTSSFSVTAEDFGEFYNSGESITGFYFPSAADAIAMRDVIDKTISRLKGELLAPSTAPPPPPPPPAAQPTEPEPAATPETPSMPVQSVAGSKGSRRRSLADFVEVAEESLRATCDAIPENSESSEIIPAPPPHPDLSSPPPTHPGISIQDVTHKLHVSFNEEKAAFEGLPDEWKHMNQQFGVALEKVPRMIVEGYDERIPAVLVMMARYLTENNGRDQVGIFRLAPDAEDCAWAKKQINTGSFNGCDDVNIVANLIKVWFRELPQGLYNNIDEALIVRIADSPFNADAVIAEYQAFAEPERSVILWLLDMMADVVMNEKVNKMGAKNMSIVMSPNLFQTNAENPMAALTMAQKIADFTTKMLAARLKEKFEYDAHIS